MTFDYIIVGAGSAGCVLADRLTRSGRHQVLLIEAGPEDHGPLIRMPKGFGKLLAGSAQVWRYTLRPGPGGPNVPAIWHRGKTLGGSSAVNGMVYTRGDPSDYDAWGAEAPDGWGLEGWNWASMGAAFQAIEDHELGEGPWRGTGGPLHVSTDPEPNATCDAFLAAGAELGAPVKPDLNDPDQQEGFGYCLRTIKAGRRVSAANAFLAPARKRANLVVFTGVLVERVLFEGGRAVGVECRQASGVRRFRCGREVILAAGALHSPKILQLSGIGPASRLASLGVPVMLDRPAVGEHLREHRVLFMQYRLNPDAFSHNRGLQGLGLLGNLIRYGVTRRGPMSLSAYEAGGFVKAQPGLKRPDVQLLMSPFSIDLPAREAAKIRPDREPGLQCLALTLRPTSEGRLAITGSDPQAPLEIEPRYLSTEADRRSAVAGVRYVRRLVRTKALAALVREETIPGPGVQSDDEILSAFLQFGSPGYHAVGTCRMGAGDDAVTNARLRVRGLAGLRVVDCSVMPSIPSGNTNGPAMALAWRAADLILEDAA